MFDIPTNRLDIYILWNFILHTVYSFLKIKKTDRQKSAEKKRLMNYYDKTLFYAFNYTFDTYNTYILSPDRWMHWKS